MCATPIPPVPRALNLCGLSTNPEICPNCGADVPPRARACPTCGSCEETGWGKPDGAEGLDLPDEEFNYDEFASREFGPEKLVPRGLPVFWWIVAVIILGIIVFTVLRGWR